MYPLWCSTSIMEGSLEKKPLRAYWIFKLERVHTCNYMINRAGTEFCGLASNFLLKKLLRLLASQTCIIYRSAEMCLSLGAEITVKHYLRAIK